MENKYDIFISYRSADELHATALKQSLFENGYEAVYFNPDEKKKGDFKERLSKAIDSCTDFILIISEQVIKELQGNDRKAFDEDYVQWEISKAIELKKEITILTVNNNYNFPANSVFNEEIESLSLHTQETKPLYSKPNDINITAIKKDLKTQITERQTLYNILNTILSTTDTKFSNDIASGKAKKKTIKKENCIVTRCSLSSLCGLISKDTSIANEMDNCKDIEELSKFIKQSNKSILKNFDKYFNFYFNKENDVICVTSLQNVKLNTKKLTEHEILEFLYDSYMTRPHESFHCSNQLAKREINITISKYIHAIACNGYYIKNDDKKDRLVEIVENLIKTHNRHGYFLYALVESKDDIPLFCNFNLSKGENSIETIRTKQVLKIFSLYYEELYNTDLSRCFVTGNFIKWLSDEEFAMAFYKKLITEHNCCDAKIWNKLCIQNNNLEVLRRKFNNYIANHEVVPVVRMIEHGLHESVWINEVGNTNLFDLVSKLLENIIQGKIKDDALVKSYSHGISRCFFMLLGKDSKIDYEIIKIVNRAYCIKKLDAFKSLYDRINGNEIPNKYISCEEVLKKYVSLTPEELKYNAEFLSALNALTVTQENKELYNICLSKLIYLCEKYDLYGFGVLIYAPENWCSQENINKKYELIHRYINNPACDFSILNTKQYKYLLKLAEEKKKISIPENFKVELFKAIALKENSAKDNSAKDKYDCLVILMNDSIENSILNKIILDNDESFSACLIELLNPFKNKLYYFDWERVAVYGLLCKLLNENVFLKLSNELQKSIIHFIKVKDEYKPQMNGLFELFSNNSLLWNNLDYHLKTAFVLHADKHIIEQNDYKHIQSHIEEIIDDINNNRYSRSGIQKKYGIVEETLIYHIVALYKHNPEKTSKLCAISLSKLLGELNQYTRSTKWNYDYEDMLHRRRTLLPVVIANPCIRPLAKFFAKAYLEIISTNFNSNDALTFSDKRGTVNNIMLQNICDSNKFPDWFGKKLKTKITFNIFNNKYGMKTLSNLSAGDIVNFEDKYMSPEFQFKNEDEIISTFVRSKKDSIDFEKKSEKIILWKYVDREDVSVLRRRKLVFQCAKREAKNIPCPKINALLYEQKRYPEILFEKSSAESDFNLYNCFKIIKDLIVGSFKSSIIPSYDSNKYFNKVKKGHLDDNTRETINRFFSFYNNYVTNEKLVLEAKDCYVGYLEYMQNWIEKFDV